MRRGKEAAEARRRRAQEREAAARAAAAPPPKAPRAAVPSTPEEALEFAASLGWTWTRMKNGYRLLHPTGVTAMMHLTVSDKRAWNNLRADLLRPTRTNLTPELIKQA